MQDTGAIRKHGWRSRHGAKPPVYRCTGTLPDKRVHKASLPQWLLLLWLRQATPAHLPVQDAKDWDMEAAETPPAAQGIQLPQGMEAVPSADIIGRYENAPIPATLQCGSRHFVFDRVQPAASGALAGNELLFAGNLVYREA
jgi:hypothetical protein